MSQGLETHTKKRGWILLNNVMSSISPTNYKSDYKILSEKDSRIGGQKW